MSDGPTDGAPNDPDVDDVDDGPAGLVLYRTEDGQTRIECVFEDETLWLTQAQMAALFETSVPNVSIHLKAIYEEGEQSAEGTIKSRLMVRTEGRRQVSRQVLHYSLPAILAVGFRVRSPRGTLFRTWATERLDEYLVKGFTMDDARLKAPPGPGVPDYFDELLERIRDIRASERRMYLRVRDTLALAADYAPKDHETHAFFQTVQNKLLFAVTGQTAPELILARANAEAPNMGLTSWRGDAVRKGDVTVSKNYLASEEITELNRIVVMFLDFAEDQARRRKQVFMRDWRERLDDFLRFNDRPVLPGKGGVERRAADEHAAAQYEAFAERRRTVREAQGERELDALAARIDRSREDEP
ncbi:MAG: virulence RhuM family protein [Sandaracinaceae bacterium]|nr:virulence RhuM family protein [Sandaracinaceae bacterium]